MPTVPRQGRKGGKISASPAIAGAEATPPMMMSPGTLPASTFATIPATSVTNSSAVTPMTLKDGMAAGAFPNGDSFDLQALLDSKRAAAAAAAQTNGTQGESGVAAAGEGDAAADAAATSGAASGGEGGGATNARHVSSVTNTATSTMTEGNVLKIDLDAVTQVGQGVVIGGNKTVRTDLQKPSVGTEVVRSRLADVLAAHERFATSVTVGGVGAEGGAVSRRAIVPAGLAELAETDVVIVRQSLTALALAVAVSTHVPQARVLVIVPHFFHVPMVAESLRRLSFVEGGPPSGVGELAGQQHRGGEELKVWVTSAETAFCLYGQPQLPPFTHVVFPGIAPATPLLSCFMLALRERLVRWNTTPGNVPLALRWVIYPADGNVQELFAFFGNMRVLVATQLSSTAAPPTANGDIAAVPVVTEFSSDEAHALAGLDILEIKEQDASRTGRRSLGPHPKLVEHMIALAARVVRQILVTAAQTTATAQRIYVITPDIQATVVALHEAGVSAEADVFSGQFALDMQASPHARRSSTAVDERGGPVSRVYVMQQILHPFDAESAVVDFVLDLGCVRRLSQPNRRESYLPLTITEWASRSEVQERRSVLGALGSGAYFALYPLSAYETFALADAHPASLVEVEKAVLQCIRAGVPMEYTRAAFASLTAAPLASSYGNGGNGEPEDTIAQGMQSLEEKVYINTRVQPPEVTFLGEIAARLPLSGDLAQLVVQGCALGLAEVAVVLAAVSALPCRLASSYMMKDAPAEQQEGQQQQQQQQQQRHAASSDDAVAAAAPTSEWAERVMASRRRAAGEVARYSDLIADAVLFLEWCTLRARNEPTQTFLDETMLNEGRLMQLKALVHYMYAQLSDYAFVDERGVDDVAALSRMTDTLRNKSGLLIFLEVAALTRNLVLLRKATDTVAGVVTGGIGASSNDHGGADAAATPSPVMSSLFFVRTMKRVVNALDSPSNVSWDRGGGVLVATRLHNTGLTIAGSCWSAIRREFCFAALLLLYPQVEYSAPVELGGGGRMVYMGITCNRHMRRFRLSIEDAARVLDFREQLNRAFDVLQALRISPRNLSRRRFVLELKKADPLFDLDDLQHKLRTSLTELATEVDVVEHQGTFETFATHILASRRLPDQQADMGASDVIMAQRFCTGELWHGAGSSGTTAALATMTSPVVTSPASLQPAPQEKQASPLAAAASPFVPPSVFLEDDEDDIEVFGESYFAKFGPIMDDDDDDE